MPKSIEEIIVTGDLAELSPEQQTAHYLQVCDALKLDHRLHPLEYMWMNDTRGGPRRLVLYVLRNGTDQLRKINGIKITKLTKEIQDGICTFIAEATDRAGQTDIATGAVSLLNKGGQDRANAIMAAETKAKRRVTLSISGVGLLDETEVADMNSNVTMMSPGTGVAAIPQQLATPVVNNTAGKEVEPAAPAAPVQIRDSRIDMYKLEILQAGGIQSVPGLSIGMKWTRYVLSKAPGKKALKDVTAEEWRVVLDGLDAVNKTWGPKGVVMHIEETIKAKA